jgi:uncharacterized protein with HEPN domain
MRNDKAYLEDILEAINRIQKYTSQGRPAFDSDELIQNWVVHHIQIIGEATGKLSDGIKAQHPEVPWTIIKAMRNVLVHFYFGVNLEKVWKATVDDLPVLKGQMEAILKDMAASSPPPP